MILICCIEDSGGMSFNGRQLSHDKKLNEYLLKKYGSVITPIYAGNRGYKTLTKLPDDANQNLLKRIKEIDFDSKEPSWFRWRKAVFIDKPKELLHIQECAEIYGNPSKIILCKWNRSYPYDVAFQFDMENYFLDKEENIEGSSHEKITIQTWHKTLPDV